MKLKSIAAITLLGLAALAACTPGSGGNIEGEKELSEEEAASRLAEIDENIEERVGTQAVTMDISVSVSNIEVEGIKMSVNLANNYVFDIPDEQLYQKVYQKAEGSYQGETMRMESTQEGWYFDGKSAIRYSNDEGTGAEVTHRIQEGTIDVGAQFAYQEASILAQATASTWTEVSYYGNEDSDTLRMSVSDGTNSMDVTFIDGRISAAKFKTPVLASFGYNEPIEYSYNISYHDSYDISLPDLNSEEWANA